MRSWQLEKNTPLTTRGTESVQVLPRTRNVVVVIWAQHSGAAPSALDLTNHHSLS